MNHIDVLRSVSLRVYKAVYDLAGTTRAGGNFGIGAGGDTSHNIDIVAEQTVISYLREKSFGCTILGEECGEIRIPGKPGGFLIMDAIDGSVNALRGIPFYCCSLAYATSDTLSSVTDAIVTNLVDGVQYSATKDNGMFIADKPYIKKVIGAEYKIITLNVSGIDEAAALGLQPVMNANHTRHFGANALEMAYVARGWLDALVDVRNRIRVQDIAAGTLLIRESGGKVLDANWNELDSDLDYSTRLSFIATSNQAIMDELVAQMATR